MLFPKETLNFKTISLLAICSAIYLSLIAILVEIKTENILLVGVFNMQALLFSMLVGGSLLIWHDWHDPAVLYILVLTLMLIFVLLTGALPGIGGISGYQWTIFVIIGLTTGSGAIFLYYVGLIRIRAMLATICELMFPITAIILDYFVNGKILTPVQWISAAIMIGSILKLSIQKPATEQ